MNRIFCCGIASNEIENAKILINSVKSYLDGFVFCVDSAPECDEVAALFEENKKNGKIVRHPWTNSHDFQFNEVLYSGAFKDGDWIYLTSVNEHPTQDWLNRMYGDINEFERQGITCLYCSGRPYLYKWTEYLWYMFTPHEALKGLDGKMAQIPDNIKEIYVKNLRELRPEKHYQEHDTKYYLYGRSNQIEAFYGKYGNEVISFHERKRRQFRKWIKDKYKLEPNLNSLIKVFEYEDLNKYTDSFFVDMLELEFCLSEYYRVKILKQDFMKDIVPKREKWSFKNFLQYKDGFYDLNYLGTRLKYEHSQNSW